MMPQHLFQPATTTLGLCLRALEGCASTEATRCRLSPRRLLAQGDFAYGGWRIAHRIAPRGELQQTAQPLVERLWPRGMKKDALRLDGWLKEVAPSDALRRWFGHDLAKWPEFQRHYFAELDNNPESWQPIMEAAQRGDVTLLYSARDAEHNSALALRRGSATGLRRPGDTPWI